MSTSARRSRWRFPTPFILDHVRTSTYLQPVGSRKSRVAHPVLGEGHRHLWRETWNTRFRSATSHRRWESRRSRSSDCSGPVSIRRHGSTASVPGCGWPGGFWPRRTCRSRRPRCHAGSDRLAHFSRSYRDEFGLPPTRDRRRCRLETGTVSHTHVHKIRGPDVRRTSRAPARAGRASFPLSRETVFRNLRGSRAGLPAGARRGRLARDSTTLDWRSAPWQYAAIHFHADDTYDCRWETDFTWTVPPDARSGYYAAILTSEAGDEEFIPFFVRPRPRSPTAEVALIASTAPVSHTPIRT